DEKLAEAWTAGGRAPDGAHPAEDRFWDAACGTLPQAEVEESLDLRLRERPARRVPEAVLGRMRSVRRAPPRGPRLGQLLVGPPVGHAGATPFDLKHERRSSKPRKTRLAVRFSSN